MMVSRRVNQPLTYPPPEIRPYLVAYLTGGFPQPLFTEKGTLGGWWLVMVNFTSEGITENQASAWFREEIIRYRTWNFHSFQLPCTLQ